MLKSLSKGLGVALSIVSLGTMASAGSLADGAADPAVEDLVLDEDDNKSVGVLPIIGLLIVGALIISNSGGDDKKTPPVKAAD